MNLVKNPENHPQITPHRTPPKHTREAIQAFLFRFMVLQLFLTFAWLYFLIKKESYMIDLLKKAISRH